MAGYTLSELEADLRSYTEVDSNVFTGAILSRFIENAEFRINNDLPMDSAREEYEGTLAADVESNTSTARTNRAPASTLIVLSPEAKFPVAIFLSESIGRSYKILDSAFPINLLRIAPVKTLLSTSV